MRILHLAESVMGGCGTYLNELVPLQIRDLGVDRVRVLIPDRHVAQVSDIDPAALLSFSRPNRTRGLYPFARGVVAAVRRFRPDIIHAHSTFAGAVARGLALMTPGFAPVIYCPHGWAFDIEQPQATRGLMKLVERGLAAGCRRIVAISEAERRAGEAAGIRAEKITVVLNGIGARVPSPDSADWPDSRLKILFVGRLDRQKGVDILIDAVRGFQDRFSVRVAGAAVLAGTVTGSAELPHVTYLGWLTKEEVARQLNACDVVVMPSRWEGFGLVALEAMRAGKAVFAAAVGGLPEIVRPGLTGLLLPPGDVAAWRAALLAATPDQLTAMGHAGAQVFRDQFTSNRTHRGILALYGTIADGQASERRRPIFINGRFLTQKTAGVQRFARELVSAIDAMLAEGEAPFRGRDWILLVPPGAADDLPLARITRRIVSGSSGHVWEQTSLAWAARGGVLVNLGNSGPLLHRRNFVVIHDAAVFRTPENFTPNYARVHRLLGRCLARLATVGTVSAFSRRELVDVLRLDAAQVSVIPNACDHYLRIVPDPTIVDRLGLTPGRYFVMVGSPSPNKNIRLALDAFAALGRGDQRLVVVGAADPAVFGRIDEPLPAGVVLAGRLPDDSVAGLLRHATALIFPSLYEGFGIPPLEAMACRCPVIAADIPPVHEACGAAARYFDPADRYGLTQALCDLIARPEARGAMVAAGEARVRHYSWRSSAAALVAALEPLG